MGLAAENSAYLRVLTYNVGDLGPPNDAKARDELYTKLFDDSTTAINVKPQIQVVGLQETGRGIFEKISFEHAWAESMAATLQPKGYVLFKKHNLNEILLCIFVHRDIIFKTRDFETESVATGVGNILGNKGGVSLRFTYNGNSLSITNSHLAAHLEKNEERIKDFNAILDNTKFKIDRSTNNILTHDYAIWFGDLNFRLEEVRREDIMSVINRAKTATTVHDRSAIYSSLYKYDQLMNSKIKGLVFQDFNDIPPVFAPTFKFEKNSEVYSDKRLPAWTDRVLYRFHQDAYNSSNQQSFKPHMEPVYFNSVPSASYSDHKPVIAILKFTTFDPEKYNPSSKPYEPVRFENITSPWKAGKDLKVWYSISDEHFEIRPKILHSIDMVTLYKSQFTSLDDYQTQVYSNNIARVEPNDNALTVVYRSSPLSSASNSPTSSRRNSISSLSDERGSPVASTPLQTDGRKYFTVTIPDEQLFPGRYRILYRSKTDSRDDDNYNVYGMSNEFEVAN